MSAGAISNWLRISHVLSIWTPLLLCASGLLFTFRAGLWNIGIEGQMVMGGICATAVLRMADGMVPPNLLLPMAMTGRRHLTRFEGILLVGAYTAYLLVVLLGRT